MFDEALKHNGSIKLAQVIHEEYRGLHTIRIPATKRYRATELIENVTMRLSSNKLLIEGDLVHYGITDIFGRGVWLMSDSKYKHAAESDIQPPAKNWWQRFCGVPVEPYLKDGTVYRTGKTSKVSLVLEQYQIVDMRIQLGQQLE